MKPSTRPPTPRAAPTGSTSPPTCARSPTTPTRSPTSAASPGTSDGGTWMTTTVGGVEVGFIGAVTEDLPVPGEPGRHRRHQDHQHHHRDQRRGRRAQGCRRGPRHPARARGCRDHQHRHGHRRLRLRPDRQRRRRRRQRDRLRPHAPGLQPLHQRSPGRLGRASTAPTSTSSSSPSTPTPTEPATNDATVAIDPAKQKILPMFGPTRTAAAPGDAAALPGGPEVKAIVDAAVAKADVLGAAVLGKIAGPFNRAKLADGTGEPRWRVHPRQPRRRGPALGHVDAPRPAPRRSPS